MRLISETSRRARFYARTKPGPNGCLLWTGAKTDGRFQLPYGYVRINKRRIRAHRRAWEFEFGSIPAGLFACHRCDTPLCVNVAHLYLGTPRENTHDALRKGRLVWQRRVAVPFVAGEACATCQRRHRGPSQSDCPTRSIWRRYEHAKRINRRLHPSDVAELSLGSLSPLGVRPGEVKSN